MAAVAHVVGSLLALLGLVAFFRPLPKLHLSSRLRAGSVLVIGFLVATMPCWFDWLDRHGAAMQAIATVVLVCVTVAYVQSASAQVLATVKVGQATVLRQLDAEYSSEDMWEASWTLGKYKREWKQSLATEFEKHLRAENDQAAEIDRHRRRLSHHFQSVRRACVLELVHEKQIAMAYGREAFDFFLDVVEPLNEVNRRVREMPARSDYAEWFRAFIHRHYKEQA
jgi:hypothetical protein